MCGIAGAVGAPVEPERARAVLDALAHRGPDSEGAIQRAGVWLGFRRLAVLDPSPRANQPMIDGDSGVALVFNGEIYNYIELRAELQRRGRTFRSTGDAEVLLAAYLEWGEGLVERCNGMFAFAVHDPRREGVLLGRDRFGEKPLHVGRDRAGRWWFASEIAAMVAAGAGTGRVDHSRVAAFLCIGDVEDPAGSYVEGIAQLPPASMARLTDRGLACERRWWVPDAVLGAPEPPRSPEAVRAALDDAVRVRLRSDVEVGTSLSGGLDSSAVVAAVRAVDGARRLHGFTASFPGEAVDEWEHAARIAAAYDVELHRVEPTLDGFLEELDRLVDHQGAPFESPTVYAQWCVMRAARDAGVTVLLDGQGADETWGGYLKYAGFWWLDALRWGRVGAATRSLRGWRALGSLPRPDLAQATALLAPARVRRQMLALVRRRLGPALRGVVLADPLGGVSGGGILERSVRVDLARSILPRLLRYADRNSMAWGREIRLPFLDIEVVRCALASNWQAGLRSGWTKHALRVAMEPRLPREIVWRRDKIAYQTPDDSWLKDRRVGDAVHAARRDLVARGLVAGDGAWVPPWRALTLSRFLDRYGLTV